MFKLNNHEVLSPDSNFHDLSIRDLIEARDLFHVHLMNKRNVIATAIGRYRIRKDPEIGLDEVRPDGGFVPNRPARTLHNSEIRDYSWPCILVFVKKWMMDSEFRAYENMNELIPRSIYMPDGRIVPICVVEAPKEDRVEVLPDQSRIVFPTNLVGGGFPLIVYSQGVQRLATCLSNVLRALEVDLVRDWNLDNDYTWGKLGHFSIAHLACGLLRSRKLKALFRNNLELITFGYDELNIKDIDSGLARMKTDHGFVPLADVPDLVWKGKVAGIKRGKEGPNHFADMDKVDSAGDACQPLHISHMFDGIPQEDGSRKGQDVHSIYETTMINKNIGAILEAAQKQLKTGAYKRPLPIDSGKEAAGATVDLMKKTFRLVKPKKLVDIVIKYKEGQGLGATATAQKMWAEVGAASTGSIFANGAYYLAALWEGAWKAGKGNSAIDDTGKVDVDELVRTYENPGFLPSVNLKEIGGVLGL